MLLAHGFSFKATQERSNAQTHARTHARTRIYKHLSVYLSIYIHVAPSISLVARPRSLIIFHLLQILQLKAYKVAYLSHARAVALDLTSEKVRCVNAGNGLLKH